MTRPLLALCAMFRDEANTVKATLESAKPFIDQWCVLDTESTDATPHIVSEIMHPLPGVLFNHVFDDYSTARNLVLDTHSQLNELTEDGDPVSVFTLFLSADETLEGGAELRAFLESHRDASDGAYCIQMQAKNRQWPYTRILRTDAKWRYRGLVHETPHGPNGEVRGPIIPGVKIAHRSSDPKRKAKRLREFDIPMLTKMAEDESKPLEERAHSLFFLAETHHVIAAECDDTPGGPKLSHQMASMAFYWRYAQIAERSDNLAHDLDKAMYAYFLYYHTADKAGVYSHEEVVPRLEILVQAAPHMPGPRYLLAEHQANIDVRKGLMLAEEAARVAKEAKTKPTFEATDDRFEWLSLRLAAVCAHQLNRYERSKELQKAAIAAGAPADMFEGT